MVAMTFEFYQVEDELPTERRAILFTTCAGDALIGSYLHGRFYDRAGAVYILSEVAWWAYLKVPNTVPNV